MNSTLTAISQLSYSYGYTLFVVKTKLMKNLLNVHYVEDHTQQITKNVKYTQRYAQVTDNQHNVSENQFIPLLYI